jgi:hypothetical protein
MFRGPAVDCKTSKNYTERFLTTGSVLGTKRKCRRHVQTDKKNLMNLGIDCKHFQENQWSAVSLSPVMRFNKTAAVAHVSDTL